MEAIGPCVREFAQPFKSMRRVRCTGCQRRYRCRVSSRKGERLRDRPCPACGSRMRPFNWGGWTIRGAAR